MRRNGVRMAGICVPMKLLHAISAIFDITLFVALAFLSLLLGNEVFLGVQVEALVMVMFYIPWALFGVIAGLIKYRLWSDRLFWMLLVTSVLASVLVTFLRYGGISAAPFDVGVLVLIASVFAIPPWQLIKAVLWGVRALRLRKWRVLSQG